MPWSLRTTYLVLTSQLRITNVAALGSGSPHCRVERQWVRGNKRGVWGKVLSKPRVGGCSHFCSTPSLVLVLHEEACRLEKEAVVRTRGPVKALVIRGVSTDFQRAGGNASSLSRGLCWQREGEAGSYLLHHQAYREQRPQAAEKNILATDASECLTDKETLPFLTCHGWILANPVKPDLEKEGEESHSQTKLNQTQYNPVLPHSDEWKAEKPGPLTTPSNPR